MKKIKKYWKAERRGGAQAPPLHEVHLTLLASLPRRRRRRYCLYQIVFLITAAITPNGNQAAD